MTKEKLLGVLNEIDDHLYEYRDSCKATDEPIDEDVRMTAIKIAYLIQNISKEGVTDEKSDSPQQP